MGRNLSSLQRIREGREMLTYIIIFYAGVALGLLIAGLCRMAAEVEEDEA